MISIPCQIAGNAPDVGDHEPCEGAFDRFLEILGEAAAPSQPCESAFNHPTARQLFETFGLVGSLYNLDGPVAHPGQRLF